MRANARWIAFLEMITKLVQLCAVVARTGLINSSVSRLSGPQGLKPAFLLAPNGTAEAVPYPKLFMRPVLVDVNERLGGRHDLADVDRGHSGCGQGRE
jgi:hypothetical protein